MRLPSLVAGLGMLWKERVKWAGVNIELCSWGSLLEMVTWKHSFFFVCFFAFSWATPAAYGGSQARGLIRAVATSLCQSHSNAGSEPCLQPTPQLMATLDP